MAPSSGLSDKIESVLDGSSCNAEQPLSIETVSSVATNRTAYEQQQKEERAIGGFLYDEFWVTALRVPCRANCPDCTISTVTVIGKLAVDAAENLSVF
jgi:hypothetical protein